MTLLITGSNGFLGSEIVRQVAQTGMRVRATDKREGLPFSAIDYCQADILNPESLRPIMRDVKTVIHAAGLAHVFDNSKTSVASFKAINEVGTANVVRAAVEMGVRHLVLISSVAVYANSKIGVNESSVCYPEGPYAESKWEAEHRAIEIVDQTDTALTILRMATVYGEEDRGNVARLIRAIQKGRFIWVGKGLNQKSLIHREDAARACLTAIKIPARGIEIYNVSSPPCTMREIVESITVALGKHPFPVRVPASLALLLSRHLSRIPNRRMGGLHQTVKKWLAEDVYDTRRFEAAYGFQTKTSLEDGLKREVDWYRQNQQNEQVAR